MRADFAAADELRELRSSRQQRSEFGGGSATLSEAAARLSKRERQDGDADPAVSWRRVG
jgi:hypothetical protein